jgi:hypothetical protein
MVVMIQIHLVWIAQGTNILVPEPVKIRAGEVMNFYRVYQQFTVGRAIYVEAPDEERAQLAASAFGVPHKDDWTHDFTKVEKLNKRAFDKGRYG